jgi:hypothetical protein
MNIDGKEGADMADILEDKQCAHPACDCPVTGGDKYCSPHCESAPESEISCGCGHAACLVADNSAYATA